MATRLSLFIFSMPSVPSIWGDRKNNSQSRKGNLFVTKGRQSEVTIRGAYNRGGAAQCRLTREQFNYTPNTDGSAYRNPEYVSACAVIVQYPESPCYEPGIATPDFFLSS